MKNVLVPIDFSDVTERVIEEAQTLCEALGAKLWLVHVAAPDPDFVGYDGGPQSVRDSVAQHLREEHRDLQQRAEALRAGGLDVVALLIQGPTVDTILGEAKRLDADMIVMGSHGHGALYRALLGSVSEGVLHKSTCPLTIVPGRSAAE